ncbi:MAG: hypothetical protein KGZ25_09125, partial [Planctomycetes bacterium]|nr:hypothetical protein [Planctomycetota bacterium]
MKHKTQLLAFTVTLLVLFVSPGTQTSRCAAGEKRERKFFAHYMGCFPVGRGASQYHRRGAKRFGGECRQYNLVPFEADLSRMESADLELRRAARIGLDGFAIDTWAGGIEAKNTLDALFWVAEKKDYPVEITICIDASCLSMSPKPGAVDAVRYLLDVHGDSPKLARRDGKVLVFGYQSIWPGVQHLWDVLGPKIGWDKRGKIAAAVGRMRRTPEGWRHIAGAYRWIEKQVGQPIYWHFGMGAFFHGVSGKKNQPLSTKKAAGIIAEKLDAVGQFTWGGNVKGMAEAVLAEGKEFSVPMLLQYENKMMGRSYGGPGTIAIRGKWSFARNLPSTLIQYTTWNDYNENTILAPGLKLRYAHFDFTGEMIRWWKTGEPPTSDHDKIYIFSRDYPHKARVYPGSSMGCAKGALEIMTILPESATVRLKGRGEDGEDATWEAPPGMHARQFPVTPGPVIVELLRDGKVAKRLEHPDPITDKPCTFNGGINAYSTEFYRHWKADFGDTD